MFWVWRIDLLTLPVFVAGAVAIIFGVRVLWRQKLAVGYLFLGWPYPYSSVLLRVLDAFTTATLYCDSGDHQGLPGGEIGGSPDGTLFVVTHHGQSFPLSIVSACSGVNSVVGFLLIGSAFAAVVRGPLVRKVLWLAGGMLLLWAINLARITFIFWAGRTWGEHIAIGVLHPFVGLVTFSLGVALMVLLIRPLGMHLGMDPPQPAKGTGGAPTPSAGQGQPGGAQGLRRGHRRDRGRHRVGREQHRPQDLQPRGRCVGAAQARGLHREAGGTVGWRDEQVATYNWAKPLFGDTSVWNRYALRGDRRGRPAHTLPVVADVITTPDLASFSAYGVEACYQFHGYSLRDVAQRRPRRRDHRPGHVVHVTAVRELVHRVLDHPGEDGNDDDVSAHRPLRAERRPRRRGPRHGEGRPGSTTWPGRSTRRTNSWCRIVRSWSRSPSQLIDQETGHPAQTAPVKATTTGVDNTPSTVPTQAVNPAVSLSSN